MKEKQESKLGGHLDLSAEQIIKQAVAQLGVAYHRLEHLWEAPFNASSFLRDVEIDYYGTATPLFQLASVSEIASEIVLTPYDVATANEIRRVILQLCSDSCTTVKGTAIHVDLKDLSKAAGAHTKALLIAAYRGQVNDIRQQSVDRLKKGCQSYAESSSRLEEINALANGYLRKGDKLTGWDDDNMSGATIRA